MKGRSQPKPLQGGRKLSSSWLKAAAEGNGKGWAACSPDQHQT